MKCDAEVALSFLAIVLFFYPTDNLKNQKLEKKNVWMYYLFTHTYLQIRLYDVWYLMYGV